MAGQAEHETVTILFVDDEEMILDIGSRFLRFFGFEVLVANCGREAVRTFEEYRQSIDLVILDVLMPDMCGAEVLRTIRQIDPQINVLISSGLRLEDQRDDFPDLSSDNFVQKPFGMTILRQKIEGILDVRSATE